MIEADNECNVSNFYGSFGNWVDMNKSELGIIFFQISNLTIIFLNKTFQSQGIYIYIYFKKTIIKKIFYKFNLRQIKKIK